MVKSSIAVKKDYAPASLARFDAGGMGQIFMNILINAIHAMPGGGEIHLRLENAKGPKNAPGVAARIADTGLGIPAEVLPRIFDFAFSTKGDRGSGLGLAISREIIQAHGGQITVKTEEGKGSEFSVWLPEAGEK